MMGQHSGKLICGYCRKETPLEDDLLLDIVEGVKKMDIMNPICSCGHFSYGSSIRFKALARTEDWKGWFRGNST